MSSIQYNMTLYFQPIKKGMMRTQVFGSKMLCRAIQGWIELTSQLDSILAQLEVNSKMFNSNTQLEDFSTQSTSTTHTQNFQGKENHNRFPLASRDDALTIAPSHRSVTG